MSAGKALEVVLEFVVVGVVFAAVLVLGRYRRRQRDARLAQRWEWAVDQCGQRGVALAYVQRVYQYARRGSKADIVWHSTGLLQDTWFHGWHAPAGVYVVLCGFTGYGPHNANPNVFYVGVDGVLGVVPGEVPRAGKRHQARLAGRSTKPGAQRLRRT